jgi:short subunit dehydrogenase-like uncharacterized protein
MADIILFGATGFTGRLIAQELRDQGLPFAITGRNEKQLRQLSDRLGGVPIRIADAREPLTLTGLMDGARVLINCVGPFSRYGEPVVNAAVECGVHYLDTTGEQTWIKRIQNRYDGIALRSGVTVINAMGFDYAIGDWLAALATRKLDTRQRVDSISIGYAVSGGGVTQGTALSIFEMSGEHGWSYEGGRWRRRLAGWTQRAMRFPWGERQVTWLPFGETVLVPRHTHVWSVLTYVHLPRALSRLLPMANRLGPFARPLLRPVAERVIARLPSGPREARRRATRFTLTAEARYAGSLTHATVSGTDAYGTTARIAALGASLLLSDHVERGVRSPAHLPVDPEVALERVGTTVLS